MNAEIFRVEWAEVARRDLEDIADFVVRRSPAAASSLLESIEQGASTLESMPNRGRIPPELIRFRVQLYHELSIPPYRLIYRIRQDTITVLGVFDGRRDLEDIIVGRLLSH